MPLPETTPAHHDGRARVIPFLVMIGARITHEADGVAVVSHEPALFEAIARDAQGQWLSVRGPLPRLRAHRYLVRTAYVEVQLTELLAIDEQLPLEQNERRLRRPGLFAPGGERIERAGDRGDAGS